MSFKLDQQPHIAFVDPLTSGSYLANSLRKMGIRLTAVYTINNYSEYFTPLPELFDHVFYLSPSETLSQLGETLSSLGVTRVYYGSEISVSTTDQLANTLCPDFANPLLSSTWRVDKYEMQEALRRAGISSINQIKVEGNLTPLQEIELASWPFPVIIKPSNGAGFLGVERCDSLEAVKLYLKNQPINNLFGLGISHFVIQEYLQGDEYLIDTFSVQGEHFLSGVQRYKRTVAGSTPVCLYSEIVLPDCPEAIASFQYVEEVLATVQLFNGFGHTEIMLTARGPYLIEVNPRISGGSGYNNKLFQACGFPAQVDLLAASCQGQVIPSPQNISYGRKVWLKNHEDRTVNPLDLTLLNTLPSFSEAMMLKEPGSLASYPQSLADMVAVALLSHSNPEQVDQDYQQLMDWEKNLQLF